MKSLPLYVSLPRAEVEVTEPADLDPGCLRCDLHKGARHVCLAADGEPGGLLVVGEGPSRAEDGVGRPFTSTAGGTVRRLLKRYWPGPVVLDNATRCPAVEVRPKHLDACRPFLAATLREAAPTRIITLGAAAAYAVLGRNVAPFTTRRGYAFLTAGRRLVPVFSLLPPGMGQRNRFVARWFEDDVAWACKAQPEVPPWDADVNVVETLADARAAIAHLRTRAWSTFDVETAGLMYDPSFRMLSLSVCAEGERDAFLWGRAALADAAVRAPLLDYLTDARAAKGGTNVKFDMQAVYCAFGVMPRGVTIDVRLWRKMLEPEAEGRLDKMSELVGMGGMKEENDEALARGITEVGRVLAYERRVAKAAALTAQGKKAPTVGPSKAAASLAALGVDARLEPVVRSDDYDKKAWAYALVEESVLHRYNARDTVATTALAEVLGAQLQQEPDLARTWEVLVQGASSAIAQVEAWGVGVNRDAVEVFDDYLGVREEEVLNKLNGFAKLDSWNSRDQIAALLFDKLKLPRIKLTDTEADSTDKEVLEALKSKHPLIPYLIDYRSLSKLRGTYARGLLPHIRPDRRIHPTLLLDGARTGRMSCQNPNLQNQPRPEKPESKMVRDCFVASPGCRLVEFDYSQIEIRVAAMLSQDETMLSILASGADFHQRTAELISKYAWGIEPHQVTDYHRTLAKAVNFGILYGKTANTLAKEWGCTIDTAQTVVDALFGQFRRLKRWMQEVLAEARHSGEVWTWWNGHRARRRPLWRVADADDYARSVAEHGSVNTPVQGTANEFCLASLVQSVDWILGDAVPARLVLAVHDSLLFDVRIDAVDEVLYTVPGIMLGHNSNGVRLKVDAKTGPSWGSMSKVTLAA